MSDQLEPFVGPRPFEREDEQYFFGRDDATSELVSLILSYPAVILYAQSGAGKTSLLKAKVLSVLEDKQGFDVPPIARVRGQGTDVNDTEIANIYVANALRDLSDNSLSPDRRAQLTFAQYLAERPHPTRPPSELDEEEEDQEGNIRRVTNSPRVLIFDQFEELFTLYPERYNDRKNFFEQLREALEQDSLLRVVFSMREDYIAELDPYVHILPDSLRTRFRLERLRKHPAVQAVLGPLTRFNEQVPPDKRIQISKEVAGALVDNLRTIKVHSGAGEVEFEGEFVEPVHLQIVCKALLKKMLAEGKPGITDRELKEFGNVNQALAEYFERAIARASQQGGVDEGKLRRWFNDVLITRENTRSTVLRGRTQTEGISNHAIDVLASERLIRSETRDNREWYELSHDKLIEPIRLSFQQWLLKQGGDEQMRLSFIARANNWLASHRKDNSLLLTAAEIASAKRWTNHEADGYNESLAALVEASQAALERVERERERKDARRLRRGAAALAVMVVVSTVSAVVAVQQSFATERARADAVAKQQLAENALIFADAQRKEALSQGDEAEKQRKLAQYQQSLAEEQAVAAQHAQTRADAAALAERRASAEARRQKTLALSSTSAARAELIIAQQPSQLNSSVKRALASLALNPTSVEGDQALRHGMSRLPLLARSIDFPALQVGFMLNGDVSAFNLSQAKLYSTDGQEKKSVRTFDHEGGYTISSDDGRFIAIISANAQARISDITDPGQPPKILSLKKPGEEPDDLWHATLSASGKYFACVVSKQLRVWEVKTERLTMEVPIVPLHPEQFSIVFTFSQNDVFIGAKDQNNVSIYKVEGGEKLFTVPHPRFGRATYTLGTNYLAVGTNDTEKGPLVNVLDLQSNTSVSQWLTSSLIDNPVLSPDETKLATTIGKQVTIWDTKSGRELRRVGHIVDVKNVVFSPVDGDLLATTGEDRTTKLWDLRTGRELFRMGHEENVNSVSFSRDGKYLVTGSNEIRLWDISRTAIGLNLYQDEPAAQVILSHNSAYVAVVTSNSPLVNPRSMLAKNLTVFDALMGRELMKLALNKPILGVAFSVDDELLLIADSHKVEARHIAGSRAPQEFVFGGSIKVIDFSADGRYAVASVLEKGVRMLDLSGKEPIKDLPFAEPDGSKGTGNVAITHDGARVFFQDRSGTLFGWDKDSPSGFQIAKGLRSGTLIKTSPDGRYLTYQDSKLTWRIFDVAKSKPIFDEQSQKGLRAVNFSKDGRYVTFALRNENDRGRVSDANRLQIYELSTQKSMAEFVSESVISQTSVSEDLKYVASGGGGLVQIWSLATKNEIARIEYGGAIRALGFSPDSKYVMTGSMDRSVRLTRLHTRDLIDIACMRTNGLTVKEWSQYFPDEPFKETCSNPK